MVRHYLTFARQTETLDEALRGWTLAESWSQEKHVLLLRFIRGTTSLFAEIAVGLEIGYALLRADASRARKNTIDFFDSLLGARLDGVTIDDGERVIRFRFADGRELAALFFGRGAGNVVLLRDGAVAESFMKYEGEHDRLLAGGTEMEPPGPERLREKLRLSTDPPAKALARALPELGKRLAAEAVHRAGLTGFAALADAGGDELDTLLAEVDRLYAACESSETFYLYHLPDEPVLALIRLTSLEKNAERIETFDDIARAVRAYRGTLVRESRFGNLHAPMKKRVESELARIERTLAKGRSEQEQADRAGEWEALGNLLLANLHRLRKGKARVMLADPEGEEREVLLDPKLTPAQNAERYFQKARSAREAATRSVERRTGIEVQHARLKRLAEELAGAATAAELETIASKNRDLLKMKNEQQKTAPGSADRFRRFEVAEGHEVYAGKNAANNDELTVRFARPNDYWFHARGSSGSHVVLRWTDSSAKPPKEAIRQAAAIAAYYSGGRNAKMVPVAYAPKKYVRKPKGAAPGSVIMEREQVIMVEPKLPEGATE